MTHSEDLVPTRDPAQATGGTTPPGVGRTAAARLFAKDSPWRAIITKGLSVAAAMVGLAAIGLFAAQAESRHVEGIPLSPVPSSFDAAQFTGTWLKPESHSKTKSTPAPLPPSGSPQNEPAEPAPAPTTKTPPTPPSSSSKPAEAAPGAPPTGITKDGKVVLNVANASELTRLPGIGAKRAEKIVKLRERLKRFRRPTDLLRIRGVGLKTLRKMLPHLVLDAPKDDSS